MTDFIHEHPKDEQPAPTPPPEPAVPELDEKTGQKRVYGYILILFVVAFSLLLWSFLMNQRSNEQVISELRGNASTLQSTLDRNIALEQQVAELESKIQTLEDEIEQLEERNETLEADKTATEAERDALQTALAEAQAALEAYQAAEGTEEAGT